MHPYVFPKHVVSPDVKGAAVKAINVGNRFKNEQEFEFRDHILQWIHTDASKMEFGVVIGRSDNGLDKRCAFVTMTCERSGKYIPPLQNFKRDDTGSRKCECPFKLCGYMLANNKLRFNIIFGLHNHDFYEKLADHPIMCRLMPKEKECVSDMTLNLL